MASSQMLTSGDCYYYRPCLLRTRSVQLKTLQRELVRAPAHPEHGKVVRCDISAEIARRSGISIISSYCSEIYRQRDCNYT